MLLYIVLRARRTMQELKATARNLTAQRGLQRWIMNNIQSLYRLHQNAKVMFYITEVSIQKLGNKNQYLSVHILKACKKLQQQCTICAQSSTSEVHYQSLTLVRKHSTASWIWAEIQVTTVLMHSSESAGNLSGLLPWDLIPNYTFLRVNEIEYLAQFAFIYTKEVSCRTSITDITGQWSP